MEWKALDTNCGGALAFHMESISEDVLNDFLMERKAASFHEYPGIMHKYLERSFNKMMEEIHQDDRPMVICTTNENQSWANEYLKEAGFAVVGECVNPNSNNIIYLWFKDLIGAEKEDDEVFDEEDGP